MRAFRVGGGPQARPGTSPWAHRTPCIAPAVQHVSYQTRHSVCCSNGQQDGVSTSTTTSSPSPRPPASPPPFNPPFNPGQNAIAPLDPTLASRVHDLCMALGVTRHTSFRLVASQPNVSISELSKKTSWLAKELSLPVEETALLESKEPLLLSTPTEQLAHTFSCLCELLGGLTKLEASRVIVFSPFLMAIPTETLRQQYAELLKVLGCSEEQLSSLLYQQPYMLNTSVPKVKRRFDQISELLRISTPQAVQLMTAYPPLCVEDPRKLQGRLSDLCNVLSADTAQVINMIIKFPPILITHPDITAARLQMLSDNLDLPPNSLSPVLLVYPTLFSSPQNLLVAQFSKLFALFGNEPKDKVLQLVVQNPGLLGLNAATTQ